ncbi:MAG: PrgI family protein [Alphaproteobacteria bacterium]|nr:PrgI family protein [Alphaproteobacteria bacterium]
MQYKVPQNLDIKDTVIFGLSFMQMIYLGGAIGLFILLVLFLGFLPGIIFSTPIAILAVLFSFYQINNQTFVTIFQAMLLYAFRSRLYTWQRNKIDNIEPKIFLAKNDYAPDAKYKTSVRVEDLKTSLDFNPE